MHYIDDSFYTRFVFGLCLILQLTSAKSSTDDLKTFSNPYGTLKFNHLAVDKNQGWIFIGAINRLYQLSPDLNLIENISTVSNDNEKCANDNCPSTAIYNYNKVLLLDYNNSQLILCGSYPNSSCDSYKIENPLRKTITGTKAVVASNSNASTVAFIAPGIFQPTLGIYKKEKYSRPALYVGATHTNDLENQSKIPAVSTRHLDKDKFLRIIESGWNGAFKTQISLSETYREKYIVNYVYGFSSGSYSYFLTTQMNSTQSSPYISKLIRIDQNDKAYNSYTEIPIECSDELGNVYNLVQAAFTTKPNLVLVKSLGITAKDDVLFGIFARSKRSLGNESNQPSNENALCVYSVKAINEKITENIQNCYIAKGDPGLEYIFSPSKRKCQKSTFGNFLNSEEMQNSPLGGSLPVRASALITFETRLTAVTAISKSNSTFLIMIGTHAGHLKHVVLGNTTTVWECNDTVIDEGSPINSDLQFDPKKEYLYAMTDQKLTKIKIRNLLPSISYFSPDKGPWEGGTNITIRYENFGNPSTSFLQYIGVAGIPCTPYKNEYKLSKEIICITNQSPHKFQEKPVVVAINGLLVASVKNFTFVDPNITDISPREGPISGGTELTIKGEYFNVGNSVYVFIGNISCKTLFYNSNIIKCTTCPSDTIMQGNITVKIDQIIRTFDIPFHYIKNSDQVVCNESVNSLWWSEIGGISPIYLLSVGIFVSMVSVSLIIASYFFYRVKSSKSSRALVKMQQNMNDIKSETFALKQHIKQLVIEKHTYLNEEQSNVLKLPNISIVLTSVQRSVETPSDSDYLLPLDGYWEFPRSKLTLGKLLGEGEFGKVYQGYVSDIWYENAVTTVAVKTLKDTHSDQDMIALVSEMEMMKLIGTHENVLCLLGCCTQDGILLVITEYALHGNLRDFLRKSLSSANKVMSRNLSEKDLLMFAKQVAEGMEYLASIKCIHRDLAARNVLVSEDYILKIGDFGLARDIHQTNYYKIKSDGRLPIKWMAPEALCHNIYTTQSDVWSFGILLWEIMTLGGTPYPSFPDMGKLYSALLSGYRMEKPPNCSQQIYNLMSKCWSFIPENRPSFSMILQNLKTLIPMSNDNGWLRKFILTLKRIPTLKFKS